MGREKRISDSRTKEITDTKGKNGAKTPERTAPVAASAAAATTAPVPRGGTSTTRAILQILLLYLGPILAIILVGKLVLHL